MKKIGLVSVHNPNYGSMLQTYALHTFLNESGYDNEIILYTKKNDFRQFVRLFNLPLLKMKWDVVYRDINCKLFHPDIYKGLGERKRSFESFKWKYLNFSRNHRGWKNLKECNKEYDTFIIGSDQVWNPVNIGTDFFNLLFTDDEKKRISYASSFGVASIPNAQRKKTAYYLRRIQHLSTREIAGQKIIKELTGRDAALVCDPTLLIDKRYWDCFKGTERFIKENYIFCYFLGNNPEHRDFANRLKKLTGYKIVALQHLDKLILSDRVFADYTPFNAGPAEFVNLVSNAEYVLTDSFHCTIFSLLYERQFFTFARFESSQKISMNSRIVSLMKLMDVEGHLITSDYPVENCLNRDIDFASVSHRISDFQTMSRTFLIDALSSVK